MTKSGRLFGYVVLTAVLQCTPVEWPARPRSASLHTLHSALPQSAPTCWGPSRPDPPSCFTAPAWPCWTRHLAGLLPLTAPHLAVPSRRLVLPRRHECPIPRTRSHRLNSSSRSASDEIPPPLNFIVFSLLLCHVFLLVLACSFFLFSSCCLLRSVSSQ